jgi:hypothetical protein
MDTFDTARLVLRVNGDTLLYDFRFGKGDNCEWFTLTDSEITDILLKGGTAHDLLRRIELSSDRVIVYSVGGLSYEGPDSGRREVKYRRLNFPFHLWRVLLRYGKLVKPVLKKAEADRDSKYEERYRDVDLSLARRQRWVKLYGQGKGQLQVTMPEESRAFFVECAARSPEFVERYENVERIALNSTVGFMETAKLKVFKDYDGFYWEALSPSGRRIMNGGIVNHGTTEKPDWSIHT